MATTYEYLGDEDKNNIIENHIRNLEYGMFNTEVSISVAELQATPDADSLAKMNQDLADAKTKITALKAKMIPITN
jgi:hypothetical protein